jgi:hypothetical protein
MTWVVYFWGCEPKSGWKAPNSKIQVPENLEAANAKSTKPKILGGNEDSRGSKFLIWSALLLVIIEPTPFQRPHWSMGWVLGIENQS